MIHEPNAQPPTDQLIVSEYQYHKYVFSPALNAGYKYGKSENVTFDRLKSDLLKSAEILNTIRGIREAFAASDQ
jgi:hypothetical protein